MDGSGTERPGCGGHGRQRNRKAWLRRPWTAAEPKGLAAAAVGGGGTEGPGCGGRGRRRGLAGLRDRSLRDVRLACGDHAGGPPPADAAHGRIKQPGPTAGSNNTRNTSGPLPLPTDTARRCRPRAHQAARPHRHAPPGTRPDTRPDTRPEHQRPHKHTPEATESGPEPLGSGPPSILSDYRRYAAGGAARQVSTSAPPQSAVSSARPPCRPCRSSRR